MNRRDNGTSCQSPAANRSGWHAERTSILSSELVVTAIDLDQRRKAVQNAKCESQGVESLTDPAGCGKASGNGQRGDDGELSAVLGAGVASGASDVADCSEVAQS